MIPEEILKEFTSANVLVTGGTGLIGRQAVGLLCDAGANVQVVSLDQINVNSSAKHVYGDLTSFDFCREVTKGMDFVLHLAGIKGSVEVTKTKPASFFVPLLMMNTNVLEACRVNNVRKVVYTSSIGAYSAAEVFEEREEIEDTPPMDTYPGWAKRMGELQVRTYQIQYGMENFAVVRPCNVYGPGDSFDPKSAMVIPSLMYRIHAGERPLVVWGDGRAIRDLAYSRDVAEGVILALHHGTGGRYINLGSGKGYSIAEIVETLRRFIDFDYVFDPSKASGFSRRVMSIDLARKMVGYDPVTSLEQGLRQTWDWYVSHVDEHTRKKTYFEEK